VDSCWEDIGESVEREGGLMAEDPFLLGPEPETDELLILAGRKLREAVEAMPFASKLPRVHVIRKPGFLKADVACLTEREEPSLR
jgi:hypothetical protein